MYPEDPDLVSSEDEKDEEMPVANTEKETEEEVEDDNSSNDSEEDDEVIEVNEEEVAELQNKIKENPYIYEAHVKLINLLRKGGELDRLRIARETMALHFPLTPEMWLQWTHDESSLLLKDSDREPVKKLFQRAIADYQDVDVWLEYCQFAIGGMGSGSPEELEEVRQVFEEALVNQGLNFAKGALLWEMYREFETIVFAQVQQNSTDTTDHITQLKRIDSIYRRQFCVAHPSMKTTMEEYREFLSNLGDPLKDQTNEEKVNSIPLEVISYFCEHTAKMNACQPFEDQIEMLSTSEGSEGSRTTTLLGAWVAYLDYAIESATQRIVKERPPDKKGPDERLQPFMPREVICLFERAITANCLEPSIWIKMADFLETYIAVDVDRLVSTLARAVRNVPWSGLIWRRYALASECQALEQVSALSLSSGSTNPSETRIPVVSVSAPSLSSDSTNASETHIPAESSLSQALKRTETIYETAVNCGFTYSADLLLVWTSYCDFWLRRLLQAPREDAEMKKQWIVVSLRQTFERAISHMEAAFGTSGDPECSLLRYWAFVEMKHIGDSSKAQSLWTQMSKIDGNGKKPSFWIAYLEFEKCFGDMKNLIRVVGMAIHSVTREFAETIFQVASRALVEAGVDFEKLREFEVTVRERRKYLGTVQPKAEQTEENPRGGKKMGKGGRKGKPETHVFARPGKRQSNNESNAPNSSPKKMRTDVPSKESDTKKIDREKLVSTPKHGEYVAHDPSKDDRTVFVSNLPFKISDTDLTNIFSKCGEISSIRLARDFAGKSKGFGYVEFASSESVQSALEMDRYPVHTADGDKSGIGRPMYVSICDPNRSKTAKQFSYFTGGPEPKKLFVRNLGKQVREDAVRTFFQQHGTVVSVRLATYRNGTPKGNAYVEFATEEDASKALVATDGVIFGGELPIEVSISNPPPRIEGGPTRKHLPPSDLPTSGPTVRSHAHSQLSFMPRALHRGGPSTSASASSTSTGKEKLATGENKASSNEDPPMKLFENAVSKSNADFRKMFNP